MENTITFLGTAGARVMVANQIRASGGMWLNLNNTQILLDPGPGSIVQSTKRKLSAEKLSGIILSHRHLDHSGDMNIMTEAMTQGGFKRHGKVFLPADALDSEPVIYSYLRKWLDGIEILETGKSYSIGDISFTTPIRHIHPVETYGLCFNSKYLSFSYIADSRYFDGLTKNYMSRVIVINVVFMEPHPTVDHLTINDAANIITEIKPEVAILSHYGMTIWQARPWELAEKLTAQLGIKVIAAGDGMKFDLDRMETVKIKSALVKEN